jgi:hypothetical protein
MDLNKFLQSKNFKILLAAIAGVIIVLLIFKVGMFVGFKKAEFSYKWGEKYHQNFAGPKGGFFNDFGRDLMGRDFIGAHGIFGQIMKIEGSEITIKGKDNVEKIVVIKDNTLIERFRETIKLNDLKTNDYIVVIGEPNDKGQLEAKFIRVMPAPPEAMPGAQPRI